MTNERLDNEMVARGLVPSREKARALIMAGVVLLDGVKANKAGQTVKEGAVVEIKEDVIPFVSRGGLKLQKAIEVFPITLEGKNCIDVGASTGGFTDCMLKSGAVHVTSLDVGYGQLDWSLRNDSRVTVMERTNARFMEPSWYPNPFDFASIDVSFISLRLILPPLATCMNDGGEVVALIKPQFEAGRSEVGKNGVVRDEAVHTRVCADMMNFAFNAGYSVLGLSYSPITGPKGNIEFLLHLAHGGDKKGTGEQEFADLAKKTVDLAHKSCITV
ncbi:MAG: TlyA family RNA methyltransferase [Eubacteriales bacterium]|nr:TlyA family RNA methyltransferase [Eubacteriales bacterium]